MSNNKLTDYDAHPYGFSTEVIIWRESSEDRNIFTSVLIFTDLPELRHDSNSSANFVIEPEWKILYPLCWNLFLSFFPKLSVSFSSFITTVIAVQKISVVITSRNGRIVEWWSKGEIPVH
ncbi:hypothetical protein AYI68_g2686 [Smittium mucronatum]|uniref:Uncharacterized protein n=1 Tax=Smittium mucronatum TaxID=133383 RepID=A0A1R0H208_9FUNG|nr:hypothetical protein AYI68_g2686 [Smittium mucronatum]